MAVDEHPELPVDPDPMEPAQGVVAAWPVYRQPLMLLVVAAGGALGAPVRYGVARWLPTRTDGWPTATFLVNVVGAFVLGSLLEALARSGPDAGWRRNVRLFAGTGFCGALTTYSTLAVEVDLLADRSRWALAVGYAVASVAAGLLAATAGIVVAVGYHRTRAKQAGAAAVKAAGEVR